MNVKNIFFRNINLFILKMKEVVYMNGFYIIRSGELIIYG